MRAFLANDFDIVNESVNSSVQFLLIFLFAFGHRKESLLVISGANVVNK